MPQPAFDFVHPALDVVNSDHGRGLGFPDFLDELGWLERWLSHWGYEAAGAPTERERQRLLSLRTHMRRIVQALDEGRKPSPADLVELNRVLAAATVRRELAASGGELDLLLVPRRRDWTWVLAEIAASLARLLAHGEPGRLKLCDNPDCRFAFYDASRNRSRRWCAQTVCGNRHKVRRFRARRRAERRAAGGASR